MLVDSHVNLHSDKYEEDLEQVIANAHSVGVLAMLTISDHLGSTDAIKDIASNRDNIWRSCGVHPHFAKDYPELEIDHLHSLCQAPDVVGVGECGLDFHYEYSDREIQTTVFKKHIAVSQKTNLPLIIHTRDADNEMQDLLETAYAEHKFVPLLHCYTGREPLAKSVLKMGGYISFSGILTFKNASDIRKIAAMAPMDRIILETDCPYLAPVPMRGRRNEPSYLVHVAEKLAEIKSMDTEEVSALTTGNFFRLFSKAIYKETAAPDG